MTAETGTRIKEKRTAAGMSQTALAEAAECVTARDISKAERGIKELTPEQLEAVAKALGVTAESLLDPAPAAEEILTDASVELVAEETLKDAPVILTEEEQEWLDLFRAADADKRQLVLFILKGTAGGVNFEELLNGLLKGFEPAELIGIVKNMLLSSNVADLVAIAQKLIGSKSGQRIIGVIMNMSKGVKANVSKDRTTDDPAMESAVESGGKQDGRPEKSTPFMTFTYLYSVSIYILLLSFYFWLWRTDIKPEK